MKAKQIALADATTKLLNKALNDDERMFMTEIVSATLEVLCAFADWEDVLKELQKIVGPGRIYTIAT